jgi:serine/threonine protein phosphatase PrpC
MQPVMPPGPSWQRADAEPSLEGMGTTLTAVAVLDDAEQTRLAVVSTGDSRAYVFREWPAHPAHS